MLPEIDTFLAMFRMLRSDLFKRQPIEVMRLADARLEDYDVFLSMESVVDEYRARKRKTQSAARK